jgi:hypothetical protein
MKKIVEIDILRVLRLMYSTHIAPAIECILDADNVDEREERLAKVYGRLQFHVKSDELQTTDISQHIYRSITQVIDEIRGKQPVMDDGQNPTAFDGETTTVPIAETNCAGDGQDDGERGAILCDELQSLLGELGEPCSVDAHIVVTEPPAENAAELAVIEHEPQVIAAASTGEQPLAFTVEENIEGANDPEKSVTWARQCSNDCNTAIPAFWATRLHAAMLQLKDASKADDCDQNQKPRTSSKADKLATRANDVCTVMEQLDSCVLCKTGRRCCDAKSCTSIVRFLFLLRVHFQRLRTIARLIYQLRQSFIWLRDVTQAVEKRDVGRLLELFEEPNLNATLRTRIKQSIRREEDEKIHSEDAIMQNSIYRRMIRECEKGFNDFNKFFCAVCDQLRKQKQVWFHLVVAVFIYAVLICR